MDTVTLGGDPSICVLLRRTARARRLSLRVSRLDGRVTLSLPMRTRERDALTFLHEKEAWIRKHLNALPSEKRVSVDGEIPFLGDMLTISQGTGRSARVDGGHLIVPGKAEMIPARIEAFLKLQAKMRLRDASDKYAKLLGTHYGRLTVRDTRSRWGSCTSEGNLMYSWRLVMAPEEVLDYVAAHEVAHRLEMNHSEHFWAHVERICPDYDQHRRWLRVQGQELHAWRFKQ